jgi:hypothetical protein
MPQAVCLFPVTPVDCPLDGWSPDGIKAFYNPDTHRFEKAELFLCDICGAEWTEKGMVPEE